MALLRIIMIAAGLLKALLQLFRERAIHDAGAKAERLLIMQAEAKANEKHVDPVRPDNVVNRLRDGGF